MSQEKRDRTRIVELEQEWKHLSERIKATRATLREEPDETHVAVLKDRLQSLIQERQEVGEELDRLEKALHSESESAKPQGKQIFISYKRNNEPDNSMAMYLERFLRDRGHQLFIDQKLNMGMEWVEEIYDQIARSDFLIVLLSPASYKSEMVLEEVKFADQQ